MRDFITKKIIKDRSEFMRGNGGGDFVKYWNKDVMLEKLKEFKLIQSLRRNYDPKTLKYYLQHMFKVDEDSRPHYTVAISLFPMDCYDFVEYTAYDQMLYYADIYYYDLIPNTHVKVDGNRIIIVDHPFVKHSNTFPSNKKMDLYPKQHISSLNRPLPLNL
jgi:hypothetical protein